jgi:hypothetical protein
MALRSLMLVSVAALVVTSFGAHAAPVAASRAPLTASGATQLVAADNTEIGARKRYRARRGNPAAGLAVMGMMIGTIGAVVAAERERDAYRRSYGAPHGYYAHPHVYPDVSALPAGPLYGGDGGHHGRRHGQPRIGW